MLKPILKFTGKAKCAFGLCFLLLLATLSVASPTEKYEPTYTKLKTVNNVVYYKIKAKEIPFNKLGIKIDKSIKRYTEQLDVKYNPYRGLVKISTEGINYADIEDLYAVIHVYDSDSMWIGTSGQLDLDHSYRNQDFLDSSEVKFAKFIHVTLKYKENDDYYFMSERLGCKDGGDTIFYVQTKKKPNGDEEYLLTCDIASLDENGLYKHWSTEPLIPSRKKFVYLEKYKDCSDTKKYFGLDSTTNECIEIATCLDDEFYDNTDNSCYTIPANSHLIENRLWACDSGYVNTGNQCLPHVTCSESEIYANWAETECSSIPSNSHKTDNFRWGCNDGYVEVEGYCYSIPSNSHKVDNFRWECDSGYVEVYGSCKLRVTCSESEIYEDRSETECSSIPENSHKINNYMWICDDGYVEVEGYCSSIPSNSHKTDNFRWECNDGYMKVGNKCLPHVTCSESEIYSDWSETECSSIPSDSHKVNNYMWICDDGYEEVGGSCIDTRNISTYVRRHVNISAAGGFLNITHIKTNHDKVTHAYESYKPFDMSFGLEYGIQGINTLTNDTLSSLGFNVATGLLLNKRKFEDFYSDLVYKELSPNWYIELGLSLNIYSIGVYAYIRPINCILASRKIETIYDVLPDSEYMLVNNFGLLLGKNFTSHFGLFAGYESLKTLDGPIVPSFELRARFTF